MIKKFFSNLFSTFPLHGIEIGSCYNAEIELSRKFEIKETRINSKESYEYLAKSNVLINLSSDYFTYYFLNIDAVNKGDSFVKDYIRWDLQVKDISLEDKEFKYIKVNSERYLVIIYKKLQIQQLIEDLKIDNSIVMPDFIGMYNYLEYSKSMEDSDSIIIWIKEENTYVMFIKDGKLNEVININIGLKMLYVGHGSLSLTYNDCNKNKWLSELDSIIRYYMINYNQENFFYSLEVLGHKDQLIVEEIEKKVNIKCYENSSFVKENISYISLIGNIYALHNKK